MVADTFEVRQHVQINHAVLRGTLVVLQAIHVVAAEGFGRRVDFVLHALHFAQQRVVRYLRLEHVQRPLHLRAHKVRQAFQLLHRLGREFHLVLILQLRRFHDVLAVVANALHVVDDVEHRADQLRVLLGQVKPLHFHQRIGDFAVQVVQHVLVPRQLFGLLRVPLVEALHRPLEVAHRNAAHALHFVEQLRHGNRRRFEHTRVKVEQLHFLGGRAVALDQQARQLLQPACGGQQQRRRRDVEENVDDGDLQLEVAGGEHLDPACQRQAAGDDDENHRADDVEEQVHRRRALGGGVCARARQQRRDASADILPEEDEDGAVQPNQPLRDERLQDADAGGGGLQDGGDARADQHAQNRVVDGRHRLLEALPRPQRLHRAGHGVHADEQDAQAHRDGAELLGGSVLVGKIRENQPQKREDGGEINLHRQQQRRDRCADVCAHNHADRLRQGHQPRVDEADDHDRRRGGGLHHRRDGDAREHGEEAVARHHAQQLFQPCTRRFFQRFAHQLHPEQEQPKSAEQG